MAEAPVASTSASLKFSAELSTMGAAWNDDSELSHAGGLLQNEDRILAGLR
jgi:hypothetical protein